jgi:hypothetical protein
LQAVAIAAMVIVVVESVDLQPKIARQVVVIQQFAVLVA